ncbi:cobalamin-binding protein [Thalassotalea sp. ND16A]|uniref:cobalamin-binding protein n=1 Tax=Thalassotalea sp. ND16A TaxID=1535422 RepID=UPI0009DFCE9B|nr:cobalamin-binding protein [Thalassotalea sp. ND16A]
MLLPDSSNVVTAVTTDVVSAISNEVADDKTTTSSVDYSQQKIIALAPHVVEVLFDLGVGERIVATTEHSDFPAQALDIPRIGNYARLKIEQILAHQPDLIIAWRTGNPSDDLQRLEQLGLNIVYSDPVNLSDVAKEFRLFGQLTGKATIAEQKAQSFEQSLNALQQKYQDKQDIKVFYELWSKPLTTVAKNAWPQQHLSICGASNPFVNLVNDYPQINIEQIIVADPDLIIQPMSQGEPNPDAIDWQKFPQVNAAKHQQLLQPNSDMLHRMSYRLLTELELLCENIDNSRNYYQQLAVQQPNQVN